MTLNQYQQASCECSICWKEQSQKLLLDTFKTHNKAEFKKAVIWCGKGGNVIRTVPGNKLSTFSDYIFKNMDDIKKGKLDVFKKISGLKKRPISWVSKICHIINPKDYPIINDVNVRSTLKIKNNPTVFNEEVDRSKCKLYINDPYRYDSEIWAFALKNEDN